MLLDAIGCDILGDFCLKLLLADEFVVDNLLDSPVDRLRGIE
jgi:hypothetical protein